MQRKSVHVPNLVTACRRYLTVAPPLRWREGDTITLNVTNHLAEDTSIHWHGIILPSSQDGVPHISDGFSGIRPGETFTYRFPVIQSGTYWYHSHSGSQEQSRSYWDRAIDILEGVQGGVN